MQAVVLAEGPGTALYPLANVMPRLVLPLCGEPVLTHLLRSLVGAGVTELHVVASRHRSAHRDLVANLAHSGVGSVVRIGLLEQDSPEGTAGSLRQLRSHLQSGSFLVLSGSPLPDSDQIRAIVAAHKSTGAAATVAVGPVSPASLENVIVDREGRVQRFVCLHESLDRRVRDSGRPARAEDGAPERRRPLRAPGVYVLEPSVLDLISAAGYQDLKEQLIPRLLAREQPVLAWNAPRPIAHFGTLRGYMALHGAWLQGAMDAGSSIDGLRQIGPGVWAGEGAEIEPGARVEGPVVLGARCRVADGASVTGPTTIGERSVLEDGARVQGSVIGRKVRIGAGAFVDRSLVHPGVRVAARASFVRTLALGESPRLELPLLRGRDADTFTVVFTRRITLSRVRRSAYRLSKRLFDVVGSLGLLVATAPVLACAAAAIALDSRGPVLYRQRRCGRHGRTFAMLKFRTMVQDAETLQGSLASDVDGPMFKMEHDPRVTRLGRFLRRTSLDELPQLINVLKGDMSLVGPRPLEMREMSFAPAWRDLRLSVKPGITGLWQVNGRHSVSFHDWIQNDIRYVSEQCLKLDVTILLRTLRVLRGGA